MEEENLINGPKRGDYRQRAHSNPLSDRKIPYPLNFNEINWKDFYPILNVENNSNIEPYPTILDIGCGYGGMSFALAPLFPNNLIMAFEIRCIVTSYVQKKIQAYHDQNLFTNLSCQWANTMRTLMRYIRPHSIEKLFILFPDPHFKKRKIKWRIISQQLMDEYAYIMKSKGRIYLVTDVRQYFEYAVPIFKEHPLFDEILDLDSDSCIELSKNSTEESKKVTLNGGQKFATIFQRK